MMKNKVTLVIFDLDGTLIDAYPAITESFNYVMDRLGLKRLSSLAIRRAVGKGDRNLLKPFIDKKRLDQGLALYRAHHLKALTQHSSVYAHTRKVLRELKDQGYFLSVASNRPTKFSQLLVKHLRLNKFFDYILCADKLKAGKPNPEIILKIMKRFKAEAKQTVFVGDMVIDAAAGRRAGVYTIIVTTGSSLKKEILPQKPFQIISDLSKLKKTIQKIESSPHTLT